MKSGSIFLVGLIAAVAGVVLLMTLGEHQTYKVGGTILCVAAAGAIIGSILKYNKEPKNDY